MDYSKVEYVKPSVHGLSYSKGKEYFTKGKVYAVQGEIEESGLCCVINNFEKTNVILIPECAHLDDAPWIPCTKDGKPL